MHAGTKPYVMNRSLASLLGSSFMVLLSSGAFAQDSTDLEMPLFLVKISPLHLKEHTLLIGVERKKFKEPKSIDLQLGFLRRGFTYNSEMKFNGATYTASNNNPQRNTIWGMSSELQLRKYLPNLLADQDPHFQLFYVAAYAKYAFFQLKSEDPVVYRYEFTSDFSEQKAITSKTSKQTIHQPGFGLLLGLHYVIGKIMYLDVNFGAGPTYKVESGVDFHYKDAMNLVAQSGLGLRANGSIGFSF